jgi:hypothetical protein
MISYEKIYNIITSIEKIALETNGIIWGSYVTSKILHGYYSNIYYSQDLDIDKYWNNSYHIETIDRIFNCFNISICFQKINNFSKFMKKCNENNIIINIFNEDDDIYMNIENCPEISINIILRSQGDMMPPFRKLLFLCDGFIMHNVNNKTIIEYSRNTGTVIDYLDNKKFKVVENNIIDDIYRKKTIISDIDEGTIFDIYSTIYDGWEIANLPYSLLSSNFNIDDTPLIKFAENNCFICLEKIFKENKAIEETAIIYSNISNPRSYYYPIHHKCIIEYILHKNSKRFTCPLKYLIDFDNCKKMFNYEYYLLNRNKYNY